MTEKDYEILIKSLTYRLIEAYRYVGCNDQRSSYEEGLAWVREIEVEKKRKYERLIKEGRGGKREIYKDARRRVNYLLEVIDELDDGDAPTGGN